MKILKRLLQEFVSRKTLTTDLAKHVVKVLNEKEALGNGAEENLEVVEEIVRDALHERLMKLKNSPKELLKHE